MAEQNVKWGTLKPAQDQAIKWNTLKPADEVSPGMDPAPTGPEGKYDINRMGAAWNKATSAVQPIVDTMLPMTGFSKEQLEQTQKAMFDVFRRPMAALTALAVETPFAEPDVGVWETLEKGFVNPEEYPHSDLAVALVDAGVEPNIAATWATIGQFGYYMGAGRVFQKAMNRFEIRNTKSTIESLEYRVNDMEVGGQKFAKTTPEMQKMFAQKPATRTVADMYLKSRGYKFAGDGIKMVDPKLAAQFGKPSVPGAVRAGEAKVARVEKFADIEKLGVTKEQFADRIPGVRQIRAAARGRDITNLKEFMTRKGASKIIESDPSLEGIKGEELVMDAAKTVFKTLSKNAFSDALYQQVEVVGQKLASQTVQDFVNLTLQVDEALTAGTATAEMLTQYTTLASAVGMGVKKEIVKDAEGKEVTLGEVGTPIALTEITSRGVAENLPPVPEGTTRLYRATFGTRTHKDLWEDDAFPLPADYIEGDSQFYSPELNYARSFQDDYGEGSKLFYVDVPEELIHKTDKSYEVFVNQSDLQRGRIAPGAPAVVRDLTKPATQEEALEDLQAVSTRQERVGQGALITPAEVVLKRLGLDTYIGSPLRQALQDTRIELADKIEFLVKTMQEHKALVGEAAFPASAEKVWQYLDKGIPANKQDTVEAKVANRFRKETEEMLNRINETNRFAGLPEVKGIKDYIFHMVNPEVINEMIKTGQIPEGFERIIRPGVSKELFLKTAIERKGMPEEFLVKDPYEVMRAMYAVDLKYINLQRALAEIEPYLRGVEHLAVSGEKWDATSVKYVQDWINHGVKRLPTSTDMKTQASLDNLLDFVFGLAPGKRPNLSFQQITGSLSAAIQTGALGLRVKVALRNALQSSFDWVMYGTEPYMKGQSAYLTEEGQAILKKSRVWRTRMPFEAQDLNKLSAFMKKGSALYLKADLRNVGVGLLTRYHFAKDTLKLSDKAAIEWADTDLPRTQWSYTREDLPEIYWSATGRTLATFGSWWMNFYTNFLPELAGKAFTGRAADGREVTPQERFGIIRFLVLLGTMEGVRRATKELTGTAIDYTGVTGPTPFGASPQAQIMLGAKDLAQGVIDSDDRKWKEGWRQIAKAGQLAIPYWLSIKETTQLFTDKKVDLIDYLFYTERPKARTGGPVF